MTKAVDVMIKFNCNNCGRKLGVKAELAGKRGKCPECHSLIVQYGGLVLLAGGVIVILRAMTSVEIDRTQQSSVTELILDTIFYAFSLYAAFIVSHLLGRFYWRYQEKLNWEV